MLPVQYRSVTTAVPDRTSAADAGVESAVYLDCNATTPLDPRVQAEVLHYLAYEYGNAGSRTHEYGQRAKERVHRAREQVAAVVQAEPEEVIFTSGATESDNLAILGLAAHGEQTGRRHLISTMIEHKAVLEPLDHLESRGFEVDLVPPTRGGWVEPGAVLERLRPDTLLVSVMHVNNETGVVQPLGELADALIGHDAYLHVDAAQGFGKDSAILRSPRIDLISVSGHKLYGPKGVGALIGRRRGFSRPPLTPLQFGGGQERGLRPGTLPVALIAGLGLAAELSRSEHAERWASWERYRAIVLEALAPFGSTVNGDSARALPSTLNISLPGLDSEAVMLALKGVVAISNGSACTSQKYEPSHVLMAMGLPDDVVRGALRLSWSHLTPAVDWSEVTRRIAALQT
jgi:cysteine desulfurase